MSNKQKHIAVIEGNIAKWQKAKEGIIAIPDEVYDAIFATGVLSELTKEEKVPVVPARVATPAPIKAEVQGGSGDDYGKNKRTLVSAFNTYKRPLRKSELIKYFENSGYTDAYDTVTNAISAAQDDKTIVGDKHGLKFRGYLWSLSEWWEDGELKEEYRIFPTDLVK